MELNERETLVKVQQDLKNAIQNHNLIMTDMRTIFQRIEKDSKVVTTIGSDLKHLTNQTNDLEKEIGEINDKIDQEIKDRTSAISDEVRTRETFETTVKASIKTAKIIAGILGGIAVLLGGLAAIFQIIQYVK